MNPKYQKVCAEIAKTEKKVEDLQGFLCLSRMADLPFVVRTATTGDLWNNTTASGWRISASG